MCNDHHPSATDVARVAPRPVDGIEPDRVHLEPVDALTLTSLIDNVSDMLLLDQGPARRVGMLSTSRMARIPEPLFEQGETVEGLHAEHGFSMLLTIHRA